MLSGKMTCGICGSAFAKGGKHRFRSQGSAKKGEAFCTNRLSVRQDVLDRRILAGLQNELMQKRGAGSISGRICSGDGQAPQAKRQPPP
ncbi:zinc ribbon domain-containing protein [Sphingopyxis sp.]|uniref:zinc ribbon domain-containing protein n=1 Tax=Sphingopyxis sp. TaxID=1908224 RepID=UPI003D6D71BE